MHSSTRTRALAAASLLALASCKGTEVETDTEVIDDADGDRDGYEAPEDCNDASAAIHPGAAEDCNGIDDDCDGDIDEDADSGLRVSPVPPEDGVSGNVPIDFALSGFSCGASVTVEVSVDGGEFAPATLAPTSPSLHDLATEGAALYDLVWASIPDTGKGGEVAVVLRFSAGSGGAPTETEPFTVNNGWQFVEATTTHLPYIYEDARYAAAGDLDADGDADVVLALHGDVSMRLLNDGTGHLAEADEALALAWPAVSENTACIETLDVDGDGDLDLFLGNQNVDSRLFVNNGSASFTDATTTWLGAVSWQVERVLVGDFDGSGTPDVYLLNSGSQPDRLLLNSGTAFTDVTDTHLPDETYSTLAGWMGSSGSVGDLDDDGDLDIVWTSFLSSQTTRIYVNDGDGVFTEESATRLPEAIQTIAMDAALIDIDSDGDLDLVEVNQLAPTLVFTNDGAGIFALLTDTLASEYLQGVDAAIGDLDRDGYDDIFLVTSGSSTDWNTDRLFRGGPSAIPVEASADVFTDVGDDGSHALLVDLDGDLDLDVIVTNTWDRTRMWINGE